MQGKNKNMNEKIIMMASVTHAFKARDVLLEHGINVQVIKTPKELSSCGCGYSIKTSEDIEKIKPILARHQIVILGTS